jgi:HAE1 family hydrophobic/amphiphilic exporter-1
VVGGLAFSQIITLYVTPVFYTYLDSLTKKRKPRSQGAPAEHDRSGERPQAAAN